VQIKERQTGDVCVIALAITAQARGPYEPLQALVRERLAAGVNKFILNLEQCEWIDSAALGELIKVQVSALRQEGQVRVASVPPKVRALLEVTNLAQVFVICSDEAEALSQLTTQHVYQFALEENLPANEQDFIRQSLREFNRQQVSYRDYQELSVVMRDETGKVCGGLLGGTMWNWLMIDYFWLAENVRGQRFGSQILAAAEAEAVRRGCDKACLDTMGFQAPDFYRKHGYVTAGELADYPQGHTRYFMHKKLG
jgi:anti-anti-sigma factor